MSHPPGPAGLTEAERTAVDAVDVDELVALVGELVAIPSITGEESAAQRHMVGVLNEAGCDVDAWEIDLDVVRSHPEHSEEVDRSEGLGVVGTFGPGETPALMLNGHIDVVPVGDVTRWSVPPWRPTIVGDRVYGRGACDMKGGLACAVAAVRAVEASGVALRRSVSIASVVGEEDGGLGTLATILRGHRADAAVIVEPTGSRLAIRQAGVLGFRIRVPGAPAHGAMRTRGVSAVEKAWPVFRALSELERVRNDRFDDPLFAGYEIPFALSIGIVQAGEWPSTVPDSLVAEGRYGVAPDEDPAAARREFEQAIVTASAGDAWLRVHPVEVSWPGGRFHPATTPDDATVVRSLAAVHTATQGTPAELTGAPYGSDLRHLVNTGGVPTVLYGPGSVHQAHVEDEYVPIEELEMVARTLAALVVRLCSDPGA